MNEISATLAKIVVDYCLFFEFSDSSIVDPDVAIKMIEQVAAELQGLSENGKESLCALFYDLSKAYDEKFSVFILQLPENLGLLES